KESGPTHSIITGNCRTSETLSISAALRQRAENFGGTTDVTVIAVGTVRMKAGKLWKLSHFLGLACFLLLPSFSVSSAPSKSSCSWEAHCADIPGREIRSVPIPTR